MPEIIVSQKYKYVAGVDTHAKTHHLTLVNNMGALVGKREIKVISHHMEKAIDWVTEKTQGNVLFAVEGTSSYGETLTVALQNRNIDVCEVKPPRNRTRGQAGKTDEVDSLRAAQHVLSMPTDKLINPKNQGVIKVLRILLTARRGMTSQSVMDKNALYALFRTNSLTPDGRTPDLTPPTLRAIADWSAETDEKISIEKAVARMEAKRLAQHILFHQTMLKHNEKKLYKIIKAIAPCLLELPGFGAITSAQILYSYSHKGRCHSAYSFACLAGTTPLEASSGQYTRHRLSKFGDRALNAALSAIILTRMRCHAPTKEYTEKRTTGGKNKREIKRTLKNYLARSIFRHLEKLDLTVNICSNKIALVC
ncbi:MAG: transposase [Oscillospiraceae bacterium]|nr:transposase [Oscillospiraceae bacterium]